MACLFAWMPTRLLCLSTSLLAGLSGVFAFARSMTLLAAVVRSALQFPPANLATANIGKPALLVLERFLATHTSLFDQKRTFGTDQFVSMAIMGYLRVTTGLRPLTIESAWRWTGATR